MQTPPRRGIRLRDVRAALAALLMLASATTATAACIGAGERGLEELESLAFRTPAIAVQRANALLAAPAATGAAAEYRATLHAIAAEAYRQLGQSELALTKARQGLDALGGSSASDLRVRLRLARAVALQANDRTPEGIAELDAAMRGIDPQSKAAACVQKDRGWMLYDVGEIERGLLDLTRAYELLRVHDDAPQRMITAGRLAAAYASAREFEQAEQLLNETISYFMASGAVSRLATTYDRLGRAFVAQGKWAEAHDAFEQMRYRATLIGDTVATAYAHIRMCGVHIEQDVLVAAEQDCAVAESTLASARNFDAEERRILHAYRGRIELARGNARGAVNSFDASLAGNPASVSRDLRAQFHLWRAEALAALGRYADAYTDTQEYLQRSRELSQSQTASQIAVLRVRFATDREIEKVRLLARENGLQQQRIQLETEKLEREQIARRLLTAIAIAAVLLIATLAFLLRRNRMFRRQLQTLADRDDLTALLNRRKILALAAQALRTSASSRGGLTIALLDLDHFKNFNDRYGHAFGDDVLRAFADAARRTLRESDQIGRYGGEEFLVIMPDTDIAAARAVIERLRETVKKLPVANEAASRDGSAQVTLSAGLASARDGETSIEEVIRRADLALYRAKETGRDRIEILPMPA